MEELGTQSDAPPLVHLSELLAAPDAHDGRVSSSCPTGLLQGVSRGLLQPSFPLSFKAAEKLRTQQLGLQYQLPAGHLLRSLPTELLYDDTGLQLFDQITYLPEYYLTAAEASILDCYGQYIVNTCVKDGALIIELGAGSMRKTRLLLDAVEHTGRQDITFAALDLCEDSLHDALTALQGCGYSNIKVAGLVGTYDDGLHFIEQHQQLPQSNGTTAASDSDTDIDALTDQQMRSSGSLESVNSDGSSLDAAIDVAISLDDRVRVGEASEAGCTGDDIKRLLLAGGPSKVILWLGSSIGNCHRDQAADFLQQVKTKAMQTGDFLLVGIDRRKANATIEAAYNDAQGVTRKFILNGLQHCCRLLDAAQTAVDTNREPSLKPADFDYFCLYNDELGRHEAYYQAKVDMAINLPAALAGPDVAGATVHITAGELISVEFSYKYNQQEVGQLAANAGLVCVKTWTDKLQQYDLHLLQRKH